MSLADLPFKRSYDSDSDDILYDFYIPALSNACVYNRLAGFFTSSSLSVSARGVIGLIKNDGRMKLITSPKLTSDDLKAIITAKISPEKYIEKQFLEDLERIENDWVKNHIELLSWMIANERLEIRIAIPNDNTYLIESELGKLFHPKIGILSDKTGHTLSFSGSINETARGWLDNLEEFKVFRGWQAVEEEYLKLDIERFETLWNNCYSRFRVVEVPSAVRSRLIEIAPSDLENCRVESLYSGPKKKVGIRLFKHQNDAVDEWWKNNFVGLFEMATGTGKTYAALGCAKRSQIEFDGLIIIIACPYDHLLQQWMVSTENFFLKYDDSIIADSTFPEWKKQLVQRINQFILGYIKNILIYTTHATLSSESFIRIFSRDELKDKRILLIADEVHNLGASKNKEGLLPCYRMRLGLSATPKRYFDDIGTKAIFDYFGKVVYEFDLRRALSQINPSTQLTYLTQFNYYVDFVQLESDELDDYIEVTKKIVRLLSIYGSINSIVSENDNELKALYFKRANIIKNARGKYYMLSRHFDQNKNNTNWAIVYCSPQQIDRVVEIANEHGLSTHRFTMNEGTAKEKRYGGKSEREHILECFAERKISVLAAMRCLDEGVDVPQARNALLMSSSGNVREYIQRIGRVIRRYPGKTNANIFDFVVVPNLINVPSEIRNYERAITEKELTRCEEILVNAQNAVDVQNRLSELRNVLWG